MAQVEIIKPGLLTTVQDKGRSGYQKFGVPVSGAMDEFSLRLGNILLKNEEYEAAIEVTMIGPCIKFNVTTLIVITGANLSPSINHSEVKMWKVLKVNSGDILEFGNIKSGARSYICIFRGIKIPKVMGSKSTYIKGAIGGLNGKSFKSGDEFNLNDTKDNLDELVGRTIEDKHKPSYKKNIQLRVIMGPQEEYFSKEGIKTFLKSQYEITNNSDRMGYRLFGNRVEHVKKADIISDGIALGSIQVPGDGMPIIMMKDGQTTGGYAKIATVISRDISLLAQGKPGDRISFKKISLEDAQILLREYEGKIENIKNSVKKINDNYYKEKEYKVKVDGEIFNVFVKEID